MPDSVFRPDPDEEWEALIRQLQAQPKAGPQPFFYGRVRARLSAQAAAKQALPGWLLRPAYAMLLGSVVLTLSGDGRALRPDPEPTRHVRTSAQPPRPLPR
ncbi:hypothetical protein IC235_01170 [Hymenobacter sp. BT664]|uniref:Uncharacterized protein n=1 Tax=Hymenobacter montanus TaxID=2771359 RepID=A0A927BAA4_9BACT|nr:hypothetical protein [Hymenobacter montanus]MBD2766499.1 hypothetical protein [Hymenobacter montanus]